MRLVGKVVFPLDEYGSGEGFCNGADMQIGKSAIQQAGSLRYGRMRSAMLMVWKGRLYVWMDRMHAPRWCPKFIWAPFYYNPDADYLVHLEMLGDSASSIIPQLTRLMRSSKSEVVLIHAMESLLKIGSNGLAAVCAAIEDRNADSMLRRELASSMGVMFVSAPQVIDTLPRVADDERTSRDL